MRQWRRLRRIVLASCCRPRSATRRTRPTWLAQPDVLDASQILRITLTDAPGCTMASYHDADRAFTPRWRRPRSEPETNTVPAPTRQIASRLDAPPNVD